MSMNFENFKYYSLSSENIDRVHKFCEENVRFVSKSIESFRNTTLNSKLFNSALNMVVESQNNQILAFFMIVLRKSLVLKNYRKVAVLKFFVVHKEWRNKGIGTYLLNQLTERIKNSDNKCFRMKFEVCSSMPDYWFPGLDPRHTEAFFFLKKHGFDKDDERINLCVYLDDLEFEKPPSSHKGYNIRRAEPDDKKGLISLSFMPKIYQLSFWSEEIKLSFQNQPITTFIAEGPNTHQILGWASHSIQFPGSFGPTGVKKSARGQGIGKLLLRWCLWDLKTNFKIKKVIINWVQEDTAYFYSKSVGSYICEIFWTMKKRF